MLDRGHSSPASLPSTLISSLRGSGERLRLEVGQAWLPVSAFPLEQLFNLSEVISPSVE